MTHHGLPGSVPGPRRATTLATPDGIQVHVQVLPPDPSLTRDVSRAWTAVTAAGVEASRFRVELEHALRRWYPLLTVVVQDDFGSIEPDPVWYVFRDGRVRQAKGWRDEMYQAMFAARDIASSSRDAIDRSRESLARANQPRRPRSRPALAETDTSDDREAGPGELEDRDPPAAPREVSPIA